IATSEGGRTSPTRRASELPLGGPERVEPGTVRDPGQASGRRLGTRCGAPCGCCAAPVVDTHHKQSHTGPRVAPAAKIPAPCESRPEEHTSELLSRFDLVCR